MKKLRILCAVVIFGLTSTTALALGGMGHPSVTGSVRHERCYPRHKLSGHGAFFIWSRHTHERTAARYQSRHRPRGCKG
jgi:hypothetical protein